jgi:hypothetical protein
LVNASGAAASAAAAACCDGEVGSLQKDTGHTPNSFFLHHQIKKTNNLGLLLTKSLKDIATPPPPALPALSPPLGSPTTAEDGALLENSASALICSPF